MKFFAAGIAIKYSWTVAIACLEIIRHKLHSENEF